MANYEFFQNKACEYFPCHKVKEEEFNCLFCYCPLYALKDKCGGDFVYLESGIKSCMACKKPHSKDGYKHIMSHIKEVMNLGKLEKRGIDDAAN